MNDLEFIGHGQKSLRHKWSCWWSSGNNSWITARAVEPTQKRCHIYSFAKKMMHLLGDTGQVKRHHTRHILMLMLFSAKYENIFFRTVSAVERTRTVAPYSHNLIDHDYIGQSLCRRTTFLMLVIRQDDFPLTLYWGENNFAHNNTLLTNQKYSVTQSANNVYNDDTGYTAIIE